MKGLPKMPILSNLCLDAAGIPRVGHKKRNPVAERLTETFQFYLDSLGELLLFGGIVFKKVIDKQLRFGLNSPKVRLCNPHYAAPI
jgi:hypothetical protein